jgi:DNA-binding Xre family transcriptional regulator
MMKMEEKHLGSNFDDFLADEELLVGVEAVAVKRVVAYQIAALMKEKQLNKSAMARQMATSRASLDRLLDPMNESVTLQTLERAAQVLGKRLRIEFV